MCWVLRPILSLSFPSNDWSPEPNKMRLVTTYHLWVHIVGKHVCTSPTPTTYNTIFVLHASAVVTTLSAPCELSKWVSFLLIYL